jgi:hypothetical protein
MTREQSEVSSLTWPSVFYVRGAEGWLALGKPEEANRELERIAPEHRAHPEVLFLRWQLQVQAQRWDECLPLGSTLAERYPDNPDAWIVLAQALYYTNRTLEAYAVGITKADEFPDCSQLLYDTARYACLLGKQDEAEHYLSLAIAAGDSEAIRLMAQRDPALEMLRAARK